MSKVNKKNKGITMLEILVAISIIAVLAMVIIPAITKYVSKGKGNYNEKLVNQLEASGKNYFAENREKLNLKNYETMNHTVEAFVSLVELQSNNYISKDFVDSDGRDCSDSFVYAVQEPNTTKTDYHPCLICGSGNDVKNYTENDQYCRDAVEEIKQPDNTPADTPEEEEDVDTNLSCALNLSGIKNPNNGTEFYNPGNVSVTANGTDKVKSILILDSDNNTKKTIDTSNMSSISNMNIVNAFDGLNDDTYKIRLEGNNTRAICNKKIIIDNTPPTCDLTLSIKDKYLKFGSVNDDSTDYANLKVKIVGTGEKPAYSDVTGYQYSLVGKNPGTYTGYVKDLVGNEGICTYDVGADIFEPGAPYCEFTKQPTANWLKAGGTTSLALRCSAAKGKTVNVDTKKIVSEDGVGSVKITKSSKDTTSDPDRVIYTYTLGYTATTKEKASSTEHVVAGAGFLIAGDKSTSIVTSSTMKVDAIPPSISFTPNKSATSEGWYKTSSSSPFKVTIKGSDKHSGMSALKVGNTKDTSDFSITVKRTSAAKPVSYTAYAWDKAGNKSDKTKKYYVKIYSRDKVCGCETYKSCRASACGCQTRNRCSACGCASGYYSYYWSGLREASGGAGACTYCSSCDARCYNLRSYTDRCTRRGAKQRMYYGYCSRTYHCSYYNRCSKCSCAVYKSCRTKSCGCKTYKACWHY